MILKLTVVLAFVESRIRRPCAAAAASRCFFEAASTAVSGVGVVAIGLVGGAGVGVDTGGLGDTVIVGGGSGALTVIRSIVVVLTPRSSVVVSVTVYVPGVVNSWLASGLPPPSATAVPSPKFQL